MVSGQLKQPLYSGSKNRQCDDEGVGEEMGEDGGQPGDERAVRLRFFVYV